MTPLSSRRHPLVATCRALARGRAPGDDRVLLDGLHLVCEALRAGLRVDTVAVTARVLDTAEGARLAGDLSRGTADLVEVTDGVMQAMSPVSSPSGIIALAARPASSLAGCSPGRPS